MESQTTNGKRKAGAPKHDDTTKKIKKNDNSGFKNNKNKFQGKPRGKESASEASGMKKKFSKASNKGDEKFQKKNKVSQNPETSENSESVNKPKTEGDSFFTHLNRLTSELWRKKESKKPKDQIVKEILGKVLPVLGKVINKRNGSKTVQACLKYGTEAQVNNIVNELIKGQHFEDMIKSKYGHYLALRVIKKCEKAQLEKIFYLLKSNIVFFVAHREASRVVDCYIRNAATPKHLNELKKNFSSIDKENVKKSEKIENIAMKIIENQSYYFILSQHILYLAFPQLVPVERNKVLDVLKSKLIQISEKREGVLLAFRIINYSQNKERKLILKEFKDKVLQITKEGSLKYLLILKLLNSIDDTVLLNKNICKEISENMAEYFTLTNGQAILYGIFNPKKSVLSSFETEADFTNSKKDQEIRKKEVAGHISDALFKHLVTQDLGNLLKNSSQSKILSNFLSFIMLEEKTEYYELPQKVWAVVLEDFKTWTNKTNINTNLKEANEKLLINHVDVNRLFKNLIINITVQINSKGNEAVMIEEFESFLEIMLKYITLFLNTRSIFLVLAYIENTSYAEKILDRIRQEEKLPEDSAPGMKALRELL